MKKFIKNIRLHFYLDLGHLLKGGSIAGDCGRRTSCEYSEKVSLCYLFFFCLLYLYFVFCILSPSLYFVFVFVFSLFCVVLSLSLVFVLLCLCLWCASPVVNILKKFQRLIFYSQLKV